ncbi:BTB/POZ domain-containing protein At1g04390 isoform X2 [Rhodamnia argentea]|uniref:BTB/POZ domain-containing protein At1g04390 isoform X2 n=1 Tax=Rhodamnia argentea TaxID=178133 RepID=A0ABM3H367_9MYRT|nr:BTB/POZ domain-containing protein At1g04390 isoform X2 [Rhodamnia argentea]
MKARRRRAETKNIQLNTLHHRLHDALNLCTRYRDGSRTRWECRDIETQRYVLRSIVAFLDCVSEETSSNPLLKDSAEDIVGALVGILHQKSEATTSIAADAVYKLASVLATSILQSYLPDLVRPLSCLSISHQLQVAIPSSRALSVLLSNLSKKKENEVWEVLDKEDITTHLIKNILDFSASPSSDVYFQEILALLAIILLKWPQSRYQVWSNVNFMNMLENFCVNTDPSLGVALLKLYSSIALCSYGAKKIMEHGETIVGAMVRFMGSSNPLSVRIEGFKLAQCLMLTEQGCSRLVSMCCEPIVEAIVCAINEWKLKEGKGANDQIPLMIEACRLAMITRWPGKHHLCFWKRGINKVLIDILMPNFVGKYPSYHTCPLEEQIAIARENLIDNLFLVLRPYAWDILGWLAIRCAEDFDPKFSENEAYFDILTVAACVAFEDIIGRGNQLCHDDVISTFRSESAVRVVLMMIFSSCKYISSKARSVLCEVLNPNGERKFRKEIRLSCHVNRLELEKLLEYVYSGYVQAEEDTVKRLKILARRCGLHQLSELLSRRIPEWATEIPSFDLKPALGQGRHKFWDIILESKATELSWTCSICSSSVPHMHVHRIILWASCDYLQALLQSGMQESQSQILKVPVSWEALVKLVCWFYSFELPEPPSGCLWSNMGTKEKLHQLELYVELSWLADFWLLEDIQDACFRIVDNGLSSARQLSVKILQMAANLSQWKLAEAAANHVAPSYRQLHESGEFDELDETLIEMVRAASVRLSQSRG